jgi:hypothetical protein
MEVVSGRRGMRQTARGEALPATQCSRLFWGQEHLLHDLSLSKVGELHFL